MAARGLLLSAGFGSGHLQAARALAVALADAAPGTWAEARNLDGNILQMVSSAYLALLHRAPGAYRSLYQAPVGSATRRVIRSIVGPAVRREIARMQPTIVAATHPFPGAAAAYFRRTGQLTAPVYMVITDFLPHPLHVQSGVDRYFVATADSARRLRVLGVSPDLITVSGIPIRPEFRSASPFSGFRVRQQRRVLVMGGGLGLGPVVSAVRSLSLLARPDLRVTVVCGNNQRLQRDLQALVQTISRVEVLGYTDQIPSLMAQADLLVTKPGGVTCSEALACSLPMLLLRPLPGQEEENALYLQGAGAAEVVYENQVGSAVERLLFGPSERLIRMRESARVVGRPSAATEIANLVLTDSSTILNLRTTG